MQGEKIMKLSASNIGWKKEYDEDMYSWMNSHSVKGLEIAPTRIIEENPYGHIKEASEWSRMLKEKWDLSVSSMQSIWYGRHENIFNSEEERKVLFEYTKRAIDFAKAVECGNLVFGCPRNRNIPEGRSVDAAYDFFKELGDYAARCETVLALEANPTMYNTNFCNTTCEATDFIKRVNAAGFRLNLDVGTIIANDEKLDGFDEDVSLINHVHISEPGLAAIQKRDIHGLLSDILKEKRYKGYVSLEIKTQDNISDVQGMLEYVGSVFAD